MSAYQISMYWLNQIYIQKVQKAKSSLPKSCKCSSFTKSRSGPELCSQSTNRIMSASPPENMPAKL